MELTAVTNLTEQSTVKDLFEDIEISPSTKRRLQKILKDEDLLKTILETEGGDVYKKIGNPGYLILCEILSEAGFVFGQHAIFSLYVWAVLNDWNDDAAFEKKIALPVDIQKLFDETELFPVLKNLRILQQMYYHADSEPDTVKKNFIIRTGLKLKLEHRIIQ